MRWLILFLSFGVQADVVQVSYTPPAEREDGTKLQPSEIKNYRVYVNGKYKRTITKNPYGITLDPGTHTVTMKTVDTNGRRSVESNGVSFTVLVPPNPPTIP